MNAFITFPHVWTSLLPPLSCRLLPCSTLLVTGEVGVLVTTFTMIAFSGKRSEESERIMNIIRSREWGLLLMDEVHVVPAAMFRTVGVRQCVWRLTHTRVGHERAAMGAVRVVPRSRTTHSEFRRVVRLVLGTWRCNQASCPPVIALPPHPSSHPPGHLHLQVALQAGPHRHAGARGRAHRGPQLPHRWAVGVGGRAGERGISHGGRRGGTAPQHPQALAVVVRCPHSMPPWAQFCDVLNPMCGHRPSFPALPRPQAVARQPAVVLTTASYCPRTPSLPAPAPR